MGNLWSRPEPRPEPASCSRDEMVDEAEADIIRASRGYFETELSCRGEEGLRQCQVKCKKNPGHQNFIPTKDFNIEHLPSRYRDNLLVDWVRATSDLTCRMSVKGISGGRPDAWPGRDQAFPFSAYKGKRVTMTGTGWVNHMVKHTERDCECDECRGPETGTHTPKKTWGQIIISTACHVVYDSEEARNTKCQFFYDSQETDINTVLTLTGLKFVRVDIKGDLSIMKYVTHDVELLDRFDKMWRCRKDLDQKVSNKYVSNKSPGLCVPGAGCDTNVDHDLCIVVSHPHGRSKVVTVGAWTQRDVVDEGTINEGITYRYNTPTCPGSSGAPLFTLCSTFDQKIGPVKLCTLPPSHSEGRPGNDNNSGVGEELLGNHSFLP